MFVCLKIRGSLSEDIKILAELKMVWHLICSKGSLFVILILPFSLMLIACGEDDAQVSQRGRSLEIHASQPVILQSMAFYDTSGDLRVLRPRASNRQLAAVSVVLVNRTALITPLLVEPDAAQIGDRRGTRIDALDPFEMSKPLETTTDKLELYSPFIWGEIELGRTTQVEGWLGFDVPKGLILGSLWWEEIDSMVVDYIDYYRGRR